MVEVVDRNAAKLLVACTRSERSHREGANNIVSVDDPGGKIMVEIKI